MSAINVLTPQQFGAVADGQLHALSSRFKTLAAAQRVFPFAQSLSESLDRCAIQQCLHVALDENYRGKTIFVDAGDYYLDQQLTVPPGMGLRLVGSGARTRLLWNGPAASAALVLPQNQECSFEHFTIHETAPGASGLLLTTTAGNFGGIVSTLNRFQGIRIEGFDSSCVVAGGSGGDANNDSHVWEDCFFGQFRTTGLKVAGSSQAHFLRLLRTTCQALSPDHTYGVWCQYGCYVHCEQCTFNGMETAVRLDDFMPGVCTVNRCNGEMLRRAVQTWVNGHGPVAPVEITGCRFAFIAESGQYTLDFDHEGPLTIRGNRFEAINDVQPLVAVRYGAQRVEHCNNSYHCVGTWTGSALRLPQGGRIASVRDEGNCYLSNDQGTVTLFDQATPLANWKEDIRSPRATGSTTLNG